MKTSSLIGTAMMFVFSLGLAQQSGNASVRADNAQILADAISEEESVVVSYHVVEKINMKFGGQVTSYNVSHLSMIATNDLGPNNTRIITPVYAKPRKRAAAETAKTVLTLAAPGSEAPTASIEIPVPVAPIKEAPAVREKKDAVAIVDIISTYERILDKGYKSIDMLKRVANSRFFDGDLAISAKWYSKLFALTTDLEPVYYYRYAQSLKSINELQKANEMMAVFERANP